LVLHENTTELEGVRLNTRALLSWGFCCLFGAAPRSLEEHEGLPDAGDHGQNPRCEGCLRRPGRQQVEERG